MVRLTPRLLPIAVFATTATMALSTGAAQAGVLVSSATSCSSETLSQPFLPWVDVAQYTPVPGGTFENNSNAWTLTGDAGMTRGNESFSVSGFNDSKSLSLPAGSSATSPAMCVGIENPDLRFFVRNTGSALSTLQVSVEYEDAFGNVQTTPLAYLSSGSSWQPTVQIPLAVNLLPLLPDNKTAVAFQFTTMGSGNWQIDDAYVDPWGRG
jgi:hypothetical protein